MASDGSLTPPASGRLSALLATWFGIGRIGPAPGTLAALTAFPLHWLAQAGPAGTGLVLLVVVVAVGFVSAAAVARGTGHHDPQIIVIDEVAGALLALAFVAGCGLAAEVAAVLLFRILDIWKPWPIRRIETAADPGLAIMGDDLAAGLAAGVLALALCALFGAI